MRTLPLSEILDENDAEAVWTRAGSGYLYLRVEGVTACYRELPDERSVDKGLHTTNWGSEAFTLKDPSGNAILISEA